MGELKSWKLKVQVRKGTASETRRLCVCVFALNKNLCSRKESIASLVSRKKNGLLALCVVAVVFTPVYLICVCVFRYIARIFNLFVLSMNVLFLSLAYHSCSHPTHTLSQTGHRQRLIRLNHSTYLHFCKQSLARNSGVSFRFISCCCCASNQIGFVL